MQPKNIYIMYLRKSTPIKICLVDKKKKDIVHFVLNQNRYLHKLSISLLSRPDINTGNTNYLQDGVSAVCIR